MKPILSREIKIVACALLLLPLSAAAGPADWEQVAKIIKTGYKDIVKVYSNAQDVATGTDGVQAVTGFHLQSKTDPNYQIRIAVQDGKVSDFGVRVAAIFLQNFHLNGVPATVEQKLALADLGALTTPVDQDSKQHFYQAAGVMEESIDDADTALFSLAGDQVSDPIKGGSNSLSAGEFEDLSEEATVVLADINNNNNDSSTWKSAAASVKPQIQSILGAQRATNKKLTKTPSDPANDKSPPLISEADAKAIQATQAETTLWNIYAGINAKISEKSGLLGKDKRLLVQDVVEAFKAAGLSDVDVRVSDKSLGRRELLITRGTGNETEILASNIKVSKAKGGGAYLKDNAINALRDQIGGAFSAAGEAALSQTRGEPPPDDSRAHSQVSEDLRWARTEETTDPPPDPTKENPDGPGEKR